MKGNKFYLKHNTLADVSLFIILSICYIVCLWYCLFLILSIVYLLYCLPGTCYIVYLLYCLNLLYCLFIIVQWQYKNLKKSISTAEAFRINANLLGHPFEMRSVTNDCKLDNSIENNWIYIYGICKVFSICLHLRNIRN